jgi:hypothetical protein
VKPVGQRLNSSILPPLIVLALQLRLLPILLPK